MCVTTLTLALFHLNVPVLPQRWQVLLLKVAVRSLMPLHRATDCQTNIVLVSNWQFHSSTHFKVWFSLTPVTTKCCSTEWIGVKLITSVWLCWARLYSICLIVYPRLLPEEHVVSQSSFRHIRDHLKKALVTSTLSLIILSKVFALCDSALASYCLCVGITSNRFLSS